MSFPDLIDSIPEKVDNCKDVCKDQLCVFFDKTDLRTGNADSAVIYVNGDNTLQDFRRGEEHRKVLMTE